MSSSRPFQTYYCASRNDTKKDEFARVGHAASEVGAIRAAVTRIFLEEYQVAAVYHYEVRIYTLVRKGGQITIHYGSAVPTVSQPSRRVSPVAAAATASLH